MAGTLTVSPSTTPFPFAAVVTAAYTQKATLNFDPEATLVLEYDGKSLTSEDEIVMTLTSAAGIVGDSTQVCSDLYFDELVS